MAWILVSATVASVVWVSGFVGRTAGGEPHVTHRRVLWCGLGAIWFVSMLVAGAV